MATDLESLILSISADTSQLRRALQRTQQDAKGTADSINRSFQNVDPMGRVAANFNRSTRAISNDAKVLGYQFNDLFTQISSGTSVTQALNQQLGQIGQVLGGAGGIRAGAGLVGQALLGLVPVAAISAAFAAVTYAATQFFSDTEDASEEARAALKKQQDEIRAIGQRWGEIYPGIKAYTDELLRAADATQLIADKQKLIAGEAEKASSSFDDFTTSIAAVRADLQAADFEAFGPLGDNLSQAFDEVQKAIKAGKDPSEAIKRLQEAIAAAAKTQVQSAKDLADTFSGTLMPALNRVLQKTQEIRDAFKDMRNPITDYSIGPGGGSFAGADEAADIGRRADALNSAAARLIKAEEGFITAAKWDVNAFRVGFGSDTYVDNMGKVQKVTEDTVVTLAQANADLSRRIVEFQNTIKGQIGGDIWRSLEENQQAALTSIAYNYGRLPASIVKAIKEGDRGQVAEAIATLSANPERRKREAAAFGGSSAAAQLRQEKQSLDDLMLSERERAALQQQIAAINANTSLTEAQRTFEIDKLEISTRLLNEAKREGIELDAKALAAIDATATALARQAQQQKEVATAAKERTRATADARQATEQLVSAGLGAFVSELRAGASAADALRAALNRVLDVVIQLAINSISQGIGSLIPTAHTGGTVGQLSGRTRVSPLVFAGAPRYHSGGVVGLKPGEVPIIAQRGEVVLPKNMAKAAGNAGGGVVNNISVDVTTGAVVANNADAKQLGLTINKAVQAVLVAERRPGGLLRA